MITSEGFFFFFSNMWAIFIISVQQWPLEFQDHFLSPSWCPHKRPRSTNIWGASLHLHICWRRRWRPLADYKSRCWAEGQAHWPWEMGGRSKTWFLVSGLFGNPWKTRHVCEWRAQTEDWRGESGRSLLSESCILYHFFLSFWAIHSFHLEFISLLYLESMKYCLFKG